MATRDGYTFGDGRDWFLEKRYGLFLHWGIYAIDEWHEQMQYRRGLSREEYRPLMERFNPAGFDPDEWLDFAESHGMEYLCITTKHIDGFCMWDTDATDFKITNTPYRKDILGMLAEACHRRNFPLNLYYSVIDNDHPAYPHTGGAYEKPAPEKGDTPSLPEYLAFVRKQVEELCTNYGELGGFWWDCDARKRLGVEDASFNELIRTLQPNAVINNRGFSSGDVDTPERDWQHAATEGSGPFAGVVEACQSIGIESWGYRACEDYYTPRHLESSMARIFARGGNYLLNVGPRADGTLPSEASKVLDPVASWLSRIGDCFDGTDYLTDRLTPDGMLIHRAVELIGRGHELFVILTGVPEGDRVLLAPIDIAPVEATILNTGTAAEWRLERLPSTWKHPGPVLSLHRLPVEQLANTVPVIRLVFARQPI